MTTPIRPVELIVKLNVDDTKTKFDITHIIDKTSMVILYDKTATPNINNLSAIFNAAAASNAAIPTSGPSGNDDEESEYIPDSSQPPTVASKGTPQQFGTPPPSFKSVAQQLIQSTRIGNNRVTPVTSSLGGKRTMRKRVYRKQNTKRKP